MRSIRKQHRFLADDVLDVASPPRRRGETFDAIILDPPDLLARQSRLAASRWKKISNLSSSQPSK
jgi:23S rRNA G2069 N7-methylase RlmK/C1962 C5-methylase RlmI